LAITSDQAILSFLADNGVAEPKKLKVAILFAESMATEFRIALREWEATLDFLYARQRETDVGLN
jgi:hypothetical protein